MNPSFKGAEATIDGAALAYRERGSGDAVVFVHGDLSDLRCWESQIGVVAGRYRAIAYSRRYAWPSDDIPPGTDNALQTHVDDLVSVQRAVRAAPAHLVGHSWGAVVCLLAAIQHPEMVRTVTLEDPPALSLFVSWSPRPGEVLRLATRRPRTALALAQLAKSAVMPAEKALRRGDDETAFLAFAIGLLGADDFKRLPPARIQQMRDNVGAFRTSLLASAPPPVRPEDVRAVAAPCLLLIGERSPAAFARIADRLEDLLPTVQRVTIQDAGHLAHEQNAAVFTDVLLRFLAAYSRDGEN